VNVDDTAQWLPLDGLRPGFHANRAPYTDRLTGHDVVVGATRYRCVAHDRIEWNGRSDACEAFEVAPGLYYAQFRAGERVARSLFVDTAFGHALEVVTRIGDGPGLACAQEFTVGAVEGVEPRGEAPGASTDLIGRRALWVYSDAHAYEHVYLSPHWYTWQCLAGPEVGLADTDACTTYRLRPGIYVFTWREKVVPCAAVTVADHTAMRSHGALFGLDESGTGTEHFTFGAHGRLLGATVHPDRYDPRAIGQAG
jgi:hypothetical protein